MDSQEAANWIRSLITKVTVRRHPENKKDVEVEIEGDLMHLLTVKGQRNDAGQKSVVSMVAEEGFEPPTQGL